LDWKDIPILACETEGAPGFARALQAGRVVVLDEVKTIATSLGTRRVCEQSLFWAKNHPIESWLTTDKAAANACLRFANDHKVLVEPACGAALAAVYERHPRVMSAEKVLVVVCGGAGVTVEKLNQWKVEYGLE
jgi:L-serine/L-threonine ammonia-lyase